MPLTMTEEREAGIRKMAAYIWRHDLGAAENAIDDALIELDATRAVLARLRAEMPGEGERAALAKLRELGKDARARKMLHGWAREQVALGPPGNYWARLGAALAALLAPEGEVSRG